MCFSKIIITHSTYWKDHVNFFEDLLESIPDYRKVVLLLFLIKNDVDLLYECGYLKNDFNCLTKKFKTFLMEQNEEYLDYVKNEEESKIEKILKKNKWKHTSQICLKVLDMNDRYYYHYQ